MAKLNGAVFFAPQCKIKCRQIIITSLYFRTQPTCDRDFMVSVMIVNRALWSVILLVVRALWSLYHDCKQGFTVSYAYILPSSLHHIQTPDQ